MSDHDTCAVGVRYSALGTYKTRPCFLDETGASKPGAFPCEKLRRPTPEEIVAHEGWFHDRDELAKGSRALAVSRRMLIEQIQLGRVRPQEDD
jgi:hypothetical protein